MVAYQAAMSTVVGAALARGLLDGDRSEIVDRFTGLLWGDLMIGLLLRTRDAPDPVEIEERAAATAAALIGLYATP